MYYLIGRKLSVLQVEDGAPKSETLRDIYDFGHDLNVASRWYDVHPDGERVLVVTTARGTPTEMIVVLNWFEELRERMGGN